jgi:hypothetical protein
MTAATTAQLKAVQERLTKEEGARKTLEGRVAVLEAVAPVPTPPPVEPPAPPVEPPSPTPDIFNGRKISDFKLEGVKAHVTEGADPLGVFGTVICLDTTDGDAESISPGTSRNQLLTPPVNGKNIITPELDYWVGYEFMLAADHPVVTSWLTVHTPAYGGPFRGASPFRNEVDGDNKFKVKANDTYDEELIWPGETVKLGHWYRIIEHTKFSANGFIEMWVDGVQVVKKNMATRDSSNDGENNYVKISNYRPTGAYGKTTSAKIYFTGLRLGTTRASVGG